MHVLSSSSVASAAPSSYISAAIWYEGKPAFSRIGGCSEVRSSLSDHSHSDRQARAPPLTCLSANPLFISIHATTTSLFRVVTETGCDIVRDVALWCRRVKSKEIIRKRNHNIYSTAYHIQAEQSFSNILDYCHMV